MWGVGWLASDSIPDATYVITNAEIEHYTDEAERTLAEFGVTTDELIVVVSLGHEAAQLAPFERAALRMGAVAANADGVPGDAFRLSLYLQHFAPALVVGLNAELVQGLDKFPDAVEALRQTTVLARPAAAKLLAERGLDVYEFLLLGPAVAVECRLRAGAHLNADSWTPSVTDGGLVVESVRDGRRVATEMRGFVLRDPCACGRPDPRIFLDRSASA
ncbi:MAG: hypothetical protein QOD72_3276 [Acidimicrobiaceae bacterium]|nr:hypothetical protein [Acidimicrobiaceae bacterium]